MLDSTFAHLAAIHIRAHAATLGDAAAVTATQWRSYMEGALESGERAALEVLSALTVSKESARTTRTDHS